MTSSSFRRPGGSSPRHYRTPSPPTDFYEPISPPASAPTFAPSRAPHEHAHPHRRRTASYEYQNGYHPGHKRVGSQGDGLDTFASIALAANGTSPQAYALAHSAYPAKASSTSLDWHGQRRKEKSLESQKTVSSGAWNNNNAEPRSGHELERRRLEAELLLNFSREACYAIPRSPTLRRPSTSRTDGQDRLTSPQTSLASPQITQHSPVRAAHTVVGQSDSQGGGHFRKSSSTSDNVVVNPPEAASIVPSQIAFTSTHPTVTSLRAASEKDGIDGHGLGRTGLEDWQSSHSTQAKVTGGNTAVEGGRKPDAKTVKPSAKMAQAEGTGVPQTQGVLESTPAHEVLPATDEPTMAKAATDGDMIPDKQDQQKETVTPVLKPKQSDSPSICASCNFARNSFPGDAEVDSTSWISCDGCRKWFHFACAGFRSEREVRAVDKYRCKSCKPIHGPTTYVRKSARAHSAIDYAGLNEGVIKTSDEDPEHHYVKDFKNGKRFTPETFARMRPELVTADFFRRGDGMKEPVLVPASFNPRPRQIPHFEIPPGVEDEEQMLSSSEELHERSALDSWLSQHFEYEVVEDDGQDALDMVIPHDLTVRKVSELYGPDEKIEVIDVKSQNGEDKRWTMKRWVDYYESTDDKVVRNVISLEVSQSKLGRLIRRPKIVRDLDLQDAVWPADLIAKGEYPKVQFYCLMSVADCYTDFHIDFGGSSVYYHILKGKKTFFFIPPHEKHLKRYEEWCNSPAQNWTFLGDQTKECYRVDLSEGDTMLIPAGWIHAVWTPEDSLVIGGNFLTPLHYPLQIRVAQIEKTTNVARKFRYPHFQKLLWYAALQYLDTDPIPDTIIDLLISGQVFERSADSINDYDACGDNSHAGPENYHARYYGRAELDGFPELCRYLLRTALIASGNITDGISVETRNAVKRSIPKGHSHGEPLDAIKKFALWCTWKRGNETIPFWAYPDYIPESGATDQAEKKLSVKARRKLDRDAAYQAFKVAPDRQSTRARQQPQNLLNEIVAKQSTTQNSKRSTPVPTPEPSETLKRKAEELTPNDKSEGGILQTKKPRTSSGTKIGSARRPACEACRKSRRACKHRDDPLPALGSSDITYGSITVDSTPTKSGRMVGETDPSPPYSDGKTLSMLHVEIVKPNKHFESEKEEHPPESNMVDQILGSNSSPQSKPSGRAKACKDCRKSKRRCVHDEFGNEDPVKLAEAAIPRPAAKRKKPSADNQESPAQKKPKRASMNSENGIIPQVPTAEAPQVQAESNVRVTAVQDSTEPVPPLQSAVDEPIAIPLDPELLALQPISHNPTQLPVFSPEDEVNLIATSPLSDVKCEPPGDDIQVVPPLASSLVSPPDSTHTDAEGTPPTTVRLKGFTPPTTSASSRQSSNPAKQQGPRYTPESGPMRRPSSSSAGAFTRESNSPAISIVPSVGSHKKNKSRTSSAIDADEESLRLIRELQAQDLGLRRRGRT